MIIFEPLYYMALVTGFLGSGHCLGMCGGFISAFSLSLPRKNGVWFHLLYNAGRIITYSLIGAMVGWFGSLLAYANTFHGVLRAVLLLSDIFIIMVGVGTVLSNTRLNIMKLEVPGGSFILARATRIYHSLPAWIAPLPIGLLMGFLPCGFAYAMVITAAQSASALKGAMAMMFFGIGTGPALLLLGAITRWLSLKARSSMLCWAGAMVAVMGFYNLGKHLKMMGWSLSGPLSVFCS